MANSWQFQVMRERGPKLRVAFQPVLLALSELLTAEGLISEDNKTEINNGNQPLPSRASRLVDLIRNQVKLDPEGNYQRFLEVLDKDKAQFREIRSILDEGEAVQSETVTAQGGGGTSLGTHGNHMNRVISSKDIGIIAERVSKWQGRIADELGLTAADVEAIKTKYPADLKLQTKEALLIWKQKNGDRATYSNLMQVFKRAECQQYADTVNKLAVPNASENRGAIGVTNPHPPPSPPVMDKPPLMQPLVHVPNRNAEVRPEDTASRGTAEPHKTEVRPEDTASREQPIRKEGPPAPNPNNWPRKTYVFGAISVAVLAILVAGFLLRRKTVP